MFRDMRRKKQQLPENEVAEILKSHTTCVLALSGDDGYPYSLPISYAYKGGKIYFHCAKVGHKIDSIKRCPKVSLCVIDSDEVIEEKYTDKYKSVIVFGKARILTDKDEIYSACVQMTKIICPNMTDDGIKEETDRFADEVAVIEITPEHITGKEGLEFYKLRK